MSENICIYCSTPINNSYNFCVNCEKQVKCLSCGEFLLAEKSKCLKCGKLVNIDSANPTMNEFTLEESQTRTSSTRKVKGTLSDTAILQVAALLSQNAPPNLRPPARLAQVTAGQTAFPFPDSSQKESPVESGQNLAQVGKAESQIKDYFSEDGNGSIVALTIDFKGENRREQQIRFMLMFVHAYNEIIGKPVPMQKTVLDGLISNNMFDINAKAKYFKFVETNYLTPIAEGYIVNIMGKKEITKVLSEMEDGSKKGFTDWDKHGKPRGKRRLNTETEKKIDSWVDADPKIGDFDIRTLKTSARYAMFGTYLITKSLAVEKAVPYVAVYEYLSKKFSTIPITKDALRKAFTSTSNAARFEKTSDGNFYLTPTAEKEVSGWLEGKSIVEEEAS